MNYSAIAVRYTKALLSLALEKGVAEKIQADMTLIQTVCKTENEFKRMLEFPVVPASKKIDVFNELFSDKVNAITIQFLKMVATNRREGHLLAMTYAYMKQYKEKRGIKTVTFTSAEKLDDKIIKKVGDLVRESYNAEIELEEEINKELIGGFVLKVDDEQYDASVVNQLEKIKKEIIN